LIRERNYEENAGNLIETDESLHHNERRIFRTFSVKKKCSKVINLPFSEQRNISFRGIFSFNSQIIKKIKLNILKLILNLIS